MAARRCSQWQKRLLAWLATEERRTRGVISRSHHERVGALHGDKGHISQSLHTLETRGLLVIVRAYGGKAAALYLTAAGKKLACQFAGSGDEGNGAGKGRRARLPRPPPTIAGARLSAGTILPRPAPEKKRRWHGK